MLNVARLLRRQIPVYVGDAGLGEVGGSHFGMPFAEFFPTGSPVRVRGHSHGVSSSDRCGYKVTATGNRRRCRRRGAQVVLAAGRGRSNVSARAKGDRVGPSAVATHLAERLPLMLLLLLLPLSLAVAVQFAAKVTQLESFSEDTADIDFWFKFQE